MSGYDPALELQAVEHLADLVCELMLAADSGDHDRRLEAINELTHAVALLLQELYALRAMLAPGGLPVPDARGRD